MATLNEQGIGPIDLVVCNLYPFEATVAQPGSTHEEIIENIDIGGPTHGPGRGQELSRRRRRHRSRPVRRRPRRAAGQRRRPDAWRRASSWPPPPSPAPPPTTSAISAYFRAAKPQARRIDRWLAARLTIAASLPPI